MCPPCSILHFILGSVEPIKKESADREVAHGECYAFTVLRFMSLKLEASNLIMSSSSAMKLKAKNLA